MAEQHPCSEKVRNSGRWPSFHGCIRAAKIERDGKWYCTIHDPERENAKRDAWEAKYQSNQVEQKRRKDKANEISVKLGCGEPIYLNGLRPSDPSGWAAGVFLTFEEAETILKRLGVVS